MKLLLLSMCLAAQVGSFVCAQDGSVKVEIKNVNHAKGGNLILSLYDNEDSYPEPDGPMKVQIMEITASSMSYTFNRLPAGNYAIVAFQDTDKDKSLRKNFIGMPKEPIGFSQNNKISFGAPSFEESQFEVAESKVRDIQISLIKY